MTSMETFYPFLDPAGSSSLALLNTSLIGHAHGPELHGLFVKILKLGFTVLESS